jgi:hypothetical protein
VCRDAGLHCTTDKVCARFGLPGDACATRADCSSYYTCDATLHCAVGAHQGEACSAMIRCNDIGNYCDSATMICTPPQPDGAACTSNSQCDSNNCAGTGTARTCAQDTVCI